MATYINWIRLEFFIRSIPCLYLHLYTVIPLMEVDKTNQDYTFVLKIEKESVGLTLCKLWLYFYILTLQTNWPLQRWLKDGKCVPFLRWFRIWVWITRLRFLNGRWVITGHLRLIWYRISFGCVCKKPQPWWRGQQPLYWQGEDLVSV